MDAIRSTLMVLFLSPLKVCLSLCPPALGWPKISPANNNTLLIHRTMYLYKVCVYICVYNDIDVERRPDCIRTVKYVSINKKKAINFGFVNNNSVSFLLYLQH